MGLRRSKADAPTTSLAAMAVDLGVELEDAPQVGAASVANIAAVLAHLLSNGHTLGSPETITPFISTPAPSVEAGSDGDKDEEAAAVDSMIPTFDHSYDVVAGSPVNSRLVRVQGVPFEATQSQIAGFFSGQ